MKAANEMFTKPAPAVKPGDLAVVVGAGVSGVAAAKLLHKLGARVRLLDRSLDRSEDLCGNVSDRDRNLCSCGNDRISKD